MEPASFSGLPCHPAPPSSSLPSFLLPSPSPQISPPLLPASLPSLGFTPCPSPLPPFRSIDKINLSQMWNEILPLFSLPFFPFSFSFLICLSFCYLCPGTLNACLPKTCILASCQTREGQRKRCVIGRRQGCHSGGRCDFGLGLGLGSQTQCDFGGFVFSFSFLECSRKLLVGYPFCLISDKNQANWTWIDRQFELPGLFHFSNWPPLGKYRWE